MTTPTRFRQHFLVFSAKKEYLKIVSKKVPLLNSQEPCCFDNPNIVSAHIFLFFTAKRASKNRVRKKVPSLISQELWTYENPNIVSVDFLLILCDNDDIGEIAIMRELPTFAKRLNGLMLQKNIKSEQLGKEIGVTGSIIRYWQRGTKQISLPNLVKLANYFTCSIDYLAGISDDNTQKIAQTPPPFPQALRRALAACGMTRHKFAWNTDFSDSYIYSWDCGSQPDLSTLIKLAKTLKCSIDFLVGREA